MLYPNNQFPAEVGSAELLCKKYLTQFYDDPERLAHIEQTKAPVKFKPVDGESFQSSFISAEPQENDYSVSEFNPDGDSFGIGGAKIIHAGFFSEAGHPLAEIRGGKSVNFVVSVKFNQTVTFPAVGIIIKDRLGQYIFTEGTDAYFREHELVCKKDDEMTVRFGFVMPILHKGVYTINVAIAEGLGDDHFQHRWIHDAIKIESLTSPVVHGFCGFINSKIQLKIESILVGNE